ncbi:MAG: DUF58 domain-containing protein [Planctomycetes bacterium]|nr:DUF58 domain-containing protein [Planctomycetota bacterium]
MAKARRITELLDPVFMARLDALDVLSRKILQGKLQGQRRSKRRGQSVEFADHKPYTLGDDLRFVDWNIYGRLDQLFLKLFLEEVDLSVHILVDASGSVSLPAAEVRQISGGGAPPADDPAGKTDAKLTGEGPRPAQTKDMAIKRLAAALTYIALVNNNRVTVSVFGDGIRAQIANMRGRHFLPQMADLLLSAEAGGPGDFNKVCRQYAAAAGGSGILIVISDFLFKEGYAEGLRRLIGRRFDLYAIQVLSPQELDPPMAGDLKLIDVEDRDSAEITISAELLRSYKRNLTGWCNELRDFLTARGAKHMLTSSAEPAETIVLNYLRTKGLLA